MSYWNEENFKGLLAIGEHYAAKQHFSAFANYCLLKEKGLKKQANAAARTFVDYAGSLALDLQRSIAAELAELSYHNAEIHQLLNHVLWEYTNAIFRAWAETTTDDATPHRWLMEPAGFRAALKIDPDDQISLFELIRRAINDIEFQTHHLDESKFIGDTAQARLDLAEAQGFINRLESEEKKEPLLERLRYCTGLLDAWDSYVSDGKPGSFPGWCKDTGFKVAFDNKHYYFP